VKWQFLAEISPSGKLGQSNTQEQSMLLYVNSLSLRDTHRFKKAKY
jgi:hypothetical protein